MGEVEELPKWWSFFGGMILSHRTILGVAKASISGSCSREAFNSGPAVTKEFDLMCWRGSECILFRLCLFWVKITSGNAFPKMRLFGWSGKFYFPEIEIRWPKKKAFDHGNAFTLLFSLQSIFEKWEREKERARAREEKIQSVRWSPTNYELQSASISRAPVRRPRRRHELQLQSKIAIDGEISRRRDRDRAVDHDLGSRSTARSSNWKHFRRWWFFFLGYGLCFLDLCFPSSFPNTRKYFPENFLKCNQTHGNIFLFRKLAFLENMYFSENVLQQPNTVLICFIDVAGQGWPA